MMTGNDEMQAKILKMHAAWKKRQQEEAVSAPSEPPKEDNTRCFNEERFNHAIEQVPLRFRNKTFDDFHIDHEAQRRVKHLAMRYVDTFADRLKEGIPILFEGWPGTGKTHLSLIMLQALAKAGFHVRYESSLHFLRVFREKNFESHASFTALMDSYKQISFLVIDEVAESCVTGDALCAWEKEMFFLLIDKRYQEGNVCTLVISNHNQNELVNRLGERIMRRIMERGITLAFNWDSYYKRKGFVSC